MQRESAAKATFCFVSDLHLYAKRSTADRYFQDIVDSANQVQHCILGGDIFDFRWSTFATPEQTADAAVEWLQNFASAAQTCQIHFILGNHDDHPLLHERLPRLTERTPNVDWNRFYYRLGNTLFLHGDVADRTMTAACLEEQRNRFQHGSRSQMAHKLYDVAVRMRLHTIAPPAVYPRRRVARRILSYITQIGHGPETGVQHVCFGHTHRPVDNYRLKSITFHNCGAPIGPSRFRIVTREADGMPPSPQADPSPENSPSQCASQEEASGS